MSLTRTQYRARILQRMDATGSNRWSSTAGSSGEVDNAMSIAFDREWRRILSHVPAYRITKRTPTSDATTGLYARSDLETTTGDSQERLFRIMTVQIDGVLYMPAPMQVYASQSDLNPMSRIYYWQGDSIMTLPKQLSKQADAFWVSHLPTRPDALSADSVTVTFPEDYDEVVILEAAKYLLSKGAAETDAAQDLAALAEEIRQDMLLDLQRRYVGATRIEYGDDSLDYGGV